MSRAPQYHREPSAPGGKGLLFTRDRVSLNLRSNKVVREAPWRLGTVAEAWRERTIKSDFDLPPDTTFGVIDSNGEAKNIGATSGTVMFYRTTGDDKVDLPYLLGDILAIDAQLSEASFAWLWNETMGRQGYLRFSINFPAYKAEISQEIGHLSDEYFLLASFEETDPGSNDDVEVGFDLSVVDEW